LKVSVYVNCNAEIHEIAKAESWVWSSYLDYIGARKGTLCNKKDIYEEFLNTDKTRKPKEYEKLCKDWAEDSKKVKYLEKYDLD